MANDNMDQTTDQAMQNAGEAGKKLANNKITNKATGAVKKSVNKLGKKAGKALMKAGVKALKALISLLLKVLAVSWPVVLAVGGLILFIVVVDHFMVENRGASQEYDFSVEAQNEYLDVTNEYGDPEIMLLSEENAFLQMFYQDEVESSYWKYYDYKDKTVMDYGNSEKLFHPDVKDKYNREDYFLLTAMNLYALEEHLNEFDAFTPQTFIQHVPFEVNSEGRLDALPLVDDEGELTVKSKEYEPHSTNEEGRTTYRKKYDKNGKPIYTEGVWDYGLAPVYHYKKYTEEYEERTSITGAQIWDIEDQKFRTMTDSELSEFVKNGRPAAYSDYSKEFQKGEEWVRWQDDSGDVPLIEESGSADVWMIQDAVTPMGSIKNEIEQTWRQTNEVVTKTHTINMNVPVEFTETVQKTNDKDEPLWRPVYYQKRYVRTERPLNGASRQTGVNSYPWGIVPDGFPKPPATPEERDRVGFQAPDGWKVEYRLRTGSGETTTDNGDSYKIMIDRTNYKMEAKSHQVETTGLKWEYIPEYVGEPDTSGLSGLEYYHQYFENYKNYVTEESFPNNSVDAFDIEVPGDDEDALEDANIHTPMDILELAKLDEKRNIGTKYDVPLTVEERAIEIEEGNLNIFTRPNEHPVMKEVRDIQVAAMLNAQGHTGAQIDLTGVNFSENANSTVVQNASEYYEYFEEYGHTYGVDPMLLMAIASRESSGSHYDGSGNVKVGAATGIMQIENLGTREVSAFNHDTGQMETFSVNLESVKEVENNIKWAAMYVAQQMKTYDYSFLAGLQAYNFGSYYKNQDWTPEGAKAYQAEVMLGGGDAGYVPNVLQYYLPTAESPVPWILTNHGEKVTADGSGMNFATDDAVNINLTQSVGRRRSSIRNSTALSEFMEKIGTVPLAILAEVGDWILQGLSDLGQLFGITDGQDKTDYYLVGSNLTGSQSEELIFTMMSYQEGLYMHEYEKMEPKEFEERFIDMFLKDVRKEQNKGMSVNPNNFFPDGYQSPVKDVDITAKYGSGREKDGFHGIQLAVPGGTEIYAVADGKISKVNDYMIEIDHGNDVKTIYMFIGEIVGKRKKGDKISKGEVIGRGSLDGYTYDSQENFSKNGSIAFGLYNPLPTDPTWIVDPSLIAGGNLGVDPNAGMFQHPYYGRNYQYTSEYGMRMSPTRGVMMLHAGVDVQGAGENFHANMPIGSIADGVVTEKGYSPNGWGHYVVVHHDHIDTGNGQNIFSLYAHMVSSSPLSKGTKVGAGDLVGYEGTTGGSTGDHLHLELIHGHGTSATAIRAQDVHQNTSDPKPYIEN